MKQATPKYKDYFIRGQFTVCELALLMAETSPLWELGRDILRLEQNKDSPYEDEFYEKYYDKKQLWGFYEKYLVAKLAIIESQRVRTGRLYQGKKHKAEYIPLSDSLDFVLELAVENRAKGGEDYKVFISVAEDSLSSILGSRVAEKKADSYTNLHNNGRSERISWWKAEYDIEDMICTAVEAMRDPESKDKATNFNRLGEINKINLAKKIAKTICEKEILRGSNRKIGFEALRAYLKKREF